MNTIEVRTKDELKLALQSKADIIEIMDLKLAGRVVALKTANKPLVIGLVTGVATCAGIAAFNAWNPLGWGIGAVGIAAGTVATTASGPAIITAGLTAGSAGTAGATSVAVAAIIALSSLGVLALVMYNDYDLDVDVSGEALYKSGPKGAGKISLKRRRNDA